MRSLKYLSRFVAAAIVLMPVWVSAGQGFYVLDKTARPGMLVSLTQNPTVVEPASDKNTPALVGVIGTSPTDFDVEPGQVDVQTDGVANVIASTLSGDIKVGDRISPSSLVGVGTKNNASGWIVGVAQGSLGADTKGAVKTTITDAEGKQRDVYVGTIPVIVKVTYYAAEQQIDTKPSAVSDNIQNLANAVAGKRASQVAIIIGGLLLLVGFAVAGFIINAAVRNGIKSIARQPLAKQAIGWRMTQSILLGLGILAGAVLAALAIIRVL